MKTMLFIFLLSGGVDKGPQPIEMPDIVICQREADAILARKKLPGVDHVIVGCMQERLGEETRAN